MRDLYKSRFAEPTKEELAVPPIPHPEERRSKCCNATMVATVDMRDEKTYFICTKCEKQDGQHFKNHKPNPKHAKEIKDHYEKLHPGRKRVWRD